MNTTINHTLTTWQNRVTDKLNTYLPTDTIEPTTLHQAMRYAVLNGGKRLRPLLVYATGTCFGGTLDKLDAPAAAVELIHCYSLVHDDLPAMDNDDLRRGKPSCHKAFDEATAILVGDALQSLAFAVLADHQPKLIKILATASGSIGMAGGQAIDLAAENKTISIADLATMHSLKTGALIKASIQLGARTANCYDQTALTTLDEFADHLGLAFQIRDDILDVESTTQQLGKAAGADQTHCKATYPSILGLDAAKAKLTQHHQAVHQALNRLNTDTSLLSRLADLLIERDY